MDRIHIEIAKIKVDAARSVKAFDCDEASRLFKLEVIDSGTHNAHQLVLRCDATYFSQYPRGTISYLVGADFHVVHDMSLTSVVQHILLGLETASSDPAGMGMPRATADFDDCEQESASWSVEPTMEYDAVSRQCDPDKSTVAPDLLRDVFTAGGIATLFDQPPIGKAVVQVVVPTSDLLSGIELDAYEFPRAAPLLVRVTCDRQHYKAAPISVTVGAEVHFKTHSFPRACVQLGSILAAFISRHTVSHCVETNVTPLQQLVDLGYDAELASKALHAANGNIVSACNLLTSESEDFFSCFVKGDSPKHLDTAGRSTSEIKAMPNEENLFVACFKYLRQRATTLPTFCVICDRTHVFAGATMMLPSVCTRELCVFRFNKLDVARDAAISVAVQSGVIDLLVNIARAACESSRWELIFKPFPAVAAIGSTPGLLPDRPDVTIARTVLRSFPQLRTILGADSVARVRAKLGEGHPLAPGMFDWVVSSNKSYIVKLPVERRIEFMGTRHQYLFVSTTPERHAAFRALKEKHGSLWAFHGSKVENWHSILRNGIKNVSGSAFQVNGAAYGAGIYLSPNASTSFGYSTLGSATTADAKSKHMQSDVIDYASMRCIAICEVVNFELRQSGSIWVQPHDHCVLTRFLLVYSHEFAEGHTVDLTNEARKHELTDLCAQYF